MLLAFRLQLLVVRRLRFQLHRTASGIGPHTGSPQRGCLWKRGNDLRRSASVLRYLLCFQSLALLDPYRLYPARPGVVPLLPHGCNMRNLCRVVLGG